LCLQFYFCIADAYRTWGLMKVGPDGGEAEVLAMLAAVPNRL
jgi:hypothetical protein